MSREASEVGTAVRAVPAAAAAAASAATGGRAARARRAKARADDSIVTPGQIRRKWKGGRVGGSFATTSHIIPEKKVGQRYVHTLAREK